MIFKQNNIKYNFNKKNSKKIKRENKYGTCVCCQEKQKKYSKLCVYCAALNFMYSQPFEERDYYTLKYCVFYNCKL